MDGWENNIMCNRKAFINRWNAGKHAKEKIIFSNEVGSESLVPGTAHGLSDSSNLS